MSDPRIYQGDLSGRWYLTTKYHTASEEVWGSSFEPVVVVDEKVDITDALAAAGLQHSADIQDALTHAQEEAHRAWDEVARLRGELGIATEPADV